MLALYRNFEDQSIIGDRLKPTFEDMTFDPLDAKKSIVMKSNSKCSSDSHYGDDLKEMSKILSKNFNLLNVNIRSL